MACDLIKNNKLSSKHLKEQMEMVEEIYEFDECHVDIVKCRDCGQAFIKCFLQVNLTYDKDDYWTFWVPACEKEIQELKKVEILYKFMGDLIYNKGHLCQNPDGNISWRDKGNSMSHLLFLT